MICIARAMAEQWGGILTEKDGGRTEKGHGSKRGPDQKGEFEGYAIRGTDDFFGGL